MSCLYTLKFNGLFYCNGALTIVTLDASWGTSPNIWSAVPMRICYVR